MINKYHISTRRFSWKLAYPWFVWKSCKLYILSPLNLYTLLILNGGGIDVVTSKDCARVLLRKVHLSGSPFHGTAINSIHQYNNIMVQHWVHMEFCGTFLFVCWFILIPFRPFLLFYLYMSVFLVYIYF